MVEHGSKSALFSCGIVLMKNPVSNCLIDLLDSLLIRLLRKRLITCGNGSLVFLQICFERGFEHLVLKRFFLNHLHALFC